MEAMAPDRVHLLHSAFSLSSAAWIRHHAADRAAFRRAGTPCRRDIVWSAELPVRKKDGSDNCRWKAGAVKKEYQLTTEGLAVLKHELARLQQLVANGESILKEE